jgi:hypothetical protein
MYGGSNRSTMPRTRSTSGPVSWSLPMLASLPSPPPPVSISPLLTQVASSWLVACFTSPSNICSPLGLASIRSAWIEPSASRTPVASIW